MQHMIAGSKLMPWYINYPCTTFERLAVHKYLLSYYKSTDHTDESVVPDWKC